MIYCVEDDDSIRDLIGYALKASGFECDGFRGGAELFAAMAKKNPELILLDIMLPDEDGIEILKKLRISSSSANIPVIMLTARTSEYDKVIGLDSGADDYITKPFGVMELISRIKAVLRRSAPTESMELISYGGIVLDQKRHIVTSDGDEVTLTYKEFELLKYLMTNIGIVLSRNQILENVWGYGYEGETRTVDMHIKTLRQKLMECGASIETVRGVGYKMTFKKSGDAK